jgi:hypothetical protein
MALSNRGPLPKERRTTSYHRLHNLMLTSSPSVGGALPTKW